MAPPPAPSDGLRREPGGTSVLVSHLGRKPTNMQYPLLAYARMARQREGLVDMEKVATADLPAGRAPTRGEHTVEVLREWSAR